MLVQNARSAPKLEADTGKARQRLFCKFPLLCYRQFLGKILDDRDNRDFLVALGIPGCEAGGKSEGRPSSKGNVSGVRRRDIKKAGGQQSALDEKGVCGMFPRRSYKSWDWEGLMYDCECRIRGWEAPQALCIESGQTLIANEQRGHTSLEAEVIAIRRPRYT